MGADEQDYEGVAYADLTFDDVDWSEVGDQDPSRRSERRGAGEKDVLTRWADEAVRDERRWVRGAGSRTGVTVKVSGYSPSGGFVITVILAPKDHPPAWRWWGATAYAAKKSERETYEGEQS